MVVFKPTEEEKVLKCECSCGCGEEIKIKSFNFGDTKQYYLSLCAEQYYAKQNGVFKTIWHRIKTAFMILRGKEYRLTEVVLKKEEFEELKEIIKEM